MLRLKNFNNKENEDTLALCNIILPLEVIYFTHFFKCLLLISPENIPKHLISRKYSELNFGIKTISSLPENLKFFSSTHIYQLLQKLHNTSQVINPVKLTMKSPASTGVSLLETNP